MNKLIKFLVGIWLAIGVTGLVLSLYHLFKKDYRDSVYFLAIVVVSVVMFFINKRRYKLYIQNPAQSSKKN